MSAGGDGPPAEAHIDIALTLHAGALVPTAIGTCCLAADRRRVRLPELAASLLMLLAMLDVWLTGWVAGVYWAAALIGGALALAAWRRPRRRLAGDRGERPMLAHTTIGMIAMAMLLVTMVAAHPESAGSHAHAHGGVPIDALVLAGCAAYAVSSAVLAARMTRRGERAQVLTMGIAVLMMAAATLA
ncbi:hypothetical protein [Microbacterium hominis]|uniref:Uncharacterized protein n=1 Tax=Microbacterium hominis TaxID=162426 RepID=A0A7D4Q9C0_9MICO|nr:hypothetical protein [Microbacterium hominis]QKJ20479.1 hypothetical protein HQM25_14690 [Microbacterium hominis]